MQTLFVALLIGFALQRMGEVGKPVLKFITYMQALVFRLLMMIMWVAPLGAFGAIAGVVGSTGAKAWPDGYPHDCLLHHLHPLHRAQSWAVCSNSSPASISSR